MKKSLIGFLLIGFVFSAFAINWLLYPTATAPAPTDTFLFATLTTNKQITATDLLNWTYTNAVWRGHVSSASNAIPGSPLFIALTALTNANNALSNYINSVSNNVIASTNSASIVRSDNLTITYAVVKNKTASDPPQVIGGSVTIASNLFALGPTFMTSNTAPRVAMSNFLVSGGVWTAPAYRGRLKLTVQVTNTIEFCLTNFNTTENHFAGRELGTGTNRVELTVDTNPNDQVAGTNWTTAGSNPGAKIISSFWSEDE